ncbi:DUF4124 domain-containing protein [Lacimicrobium alkaliphilum]|uniref:DUF4124 domain-containing protein n=1 Tax=Lacimicrobium alkaliphilum TaxID=1526571 RepID=A0ABQ1RC41_9ALTE|nr:DUF4124 domain-containing protein [Lacimicrobium alkaliphilum]GGD62219.1 hypothetical protein GCM10011357_16870 [Lacimicrobium alkaliphilum]
MRYFWLMLLLMTTAQADTLYKVIKADGTVMYTDQPVAGAEPVELPRVNTAESLAAKNAAASRNKSDRPEVQYQLSILYPKSQQTLRDNQGKVTVVAQMQPQTTGAGAFELLMDGKSLATSPSPRFELTEVNRGAHTIEVRYVNNSGKVLASSSPTEFFLHQASVLNRPQ